MKKRCFSVLLILLIGLLSLPALGDEEIQSIEQLRSPGARIGVSQGSAAEMTIISEFPDAQIVYFNDNNTAYLAVSQGKADAFIYDLNQMRIAIEDGVSEVHLLEETLGEPVRIAVGLSSVSAIPELEQKINQFIAEIKADGTLDDMFRRWVIKKDENMPEIPAVQDPAVHLTVGTTGIVRPYSFYVGTELTGYDIELARRFAAWLGADLTFKVYDYGSVIAAAATGDIDLIMANLNITKERAEAIPFSDILYEEKLGVMVRGEQADTATAVTKTPADFNGLRGGAITGSLHDTVISEELPKSSISQYASYTDMIAGLIGDKIDFFLASTEVATHLIESESELTTLREPVRQLEIGAMFAKSKHGNALKAQMDEFITWIRADGTLEEIYRFWSDPANDSTAVDMSGLTGENGTLHFATSGTKVPSSFVVDGKIAGTDPDIAVRFCREYGYKIKVSIVDTAGIIPGLVSGMFDFSLSDMVITAERKESVSFSIPYHESELLMVTRKEDAGIEEEEKTSPGFMEQLATSFNKTFIREDRWILFAQGIGVTLLITVLSLLLGTAFGFLIFMLCRNGNAVANRFTQFFTGLVQGMPVVVLLMVLYYIVFGRMSMSGVVVSVIGFTLIFGSSVFGLLKIGVGMIEPGQYEAAYALGHTSRHTFFRIILPQAIPHILPAYRGEIVGLIKATSIVGYITVQDLTKMGDIVRSRTYEAFFPLIAVTVIYFVLEALFNVLVRGIQVRIDPKRRSRESILKGLKIHD
ncbi:MAG: transporter substrate-binding domain-containing protein [Clostridia bacterium]|nr:transporter substrate-binding domain-containing protein [Clostridia bacterium]